MAKEITKDLEHHCQIIQEKLAKTAASMVETALAIKNARDSLGHEIFNMDLSEKLGMSPSTLSKWLSIANSKAIQQNKDRLPPSFTATYLLSTFEKVMMKQVLSTPDQPSVLEPFFESGEIGTQSQSKDIRYLIKTHTPDTTKKRDPLHGWKPMEITSQRVIRMLANLDEKEELKLAKNQLMEIMKSKLEEVLDIEFDNMTAEEKADLATASLQYDGIYWQIMSQVLVDYLPPDVREEVELKTNKTLDWISNFNRPFHTRRGALDAISKKDDKKIDWT